MENQYHFNQEEHFGPAYEQWIRLWTAYEKDFAVEKKCVKKAIKDKDEHAIKKQMIMNRILPWFRSPDTSLTALEGLTSEIVSFFEYISSNNEARMKRIHIIKQITEIVRSIWVDGVVKCFGSFAVGLCLPSSDIDLLVSLENEPDPYLKLINKLKEEKFCAHAQIITLASGQKLIQLREKFSSIKVDISFNINSGIKNTEVIKRYMDTYPLLKYLILILKHFLNQRNYNENFTGGISSFSLILMIVSFLQQHSKPSICNEPTHLGRLLIEFFELYGKRFVYETTGITMSHGGKHVPKNSLIRNMYPMKNEPILCIEDPTDPKCNVGRCSYNILKIKESFAHAYQGLAVCVLSPYQHLIKNEHNSILGRIIWFSK